MRPIFTAYLPLEGSWILDFLVRRLEEKSNEYLLVSLYKSIEVYLSNPVTYERAIMLC